jgi:hypothetical protein
MSQAAIPEVPMIEGDCVRGGGPEGRSRVDEVEAA